MRSEAFRRPVRAARAFGRAAPERRRLLAEALVAVVVARIAVSCLRFESLARIAKSGRPRRTASPPPPAAGEIAAAIVSASRLVPRATCLVQALAGQYLLARRGHGSALRIGVARADDGTFSAHAWLEDSGGPLIGGSGVGLTTLISSATRR